MKDDSNRPSVIPIENVEYIKTLTETLEDIGTLASDKVITGYLIVLTYLENEKTTETEDSIEEHRLFEFNGNLQRLSRHCKDGIKNCEEIAKQYLSKNNGDTLH